MRGVELLLSESEHEANAIPLQQSEFGEMVATTLIGAKHRPELKDIAAAAGQQTLHGRFRRGAQIPALFGVKGIVDGEVAEGGLGGGLR